MLLLLLALAAAPALEDALQRARPGDTVTIPVGVYAPLAISVSGTKEAPIRVRAASRGRAIFDGSMVAAGAWKRVRGEVWAASCPQAPLTVIVDDTVIPRVDDPGALAETSYAFREGTVYLWCPRGGDPSKRETGVVAGDRRRLVTVQGDWVILEGIMARFSSGAGIAVTGKHCEVRNSEVKWSAGDGLRFYRPAAFGRAVNNVVHDNFCANFVRGSRNGGWGYGLGTGAEVPDCEFIGNTSYRNNGEGLGCYNQSHRTVVRNNTVYDNWSVNIYVDSAADCLVDGNMVYNTGRVPEPNHRRSRPVGIMCADEVYRGGPYLKGLTVINNVVVNCQRGFSFSRWQGAMGGSVLKESLVANNTLVDNDVGISLAETLASTLIANNIVLQTNGKLCVATPNGDVEAVNPEWRNNLFFGTEPACFSWPKQALTFDQWRKAARRVSGCIWSDPELLVGKSVEAASYRLGRGSAAIDAGAALKEVGHDAAGKPRPRGQAIDIGAFEFVP